MFKLGTEKVNLSADGGFHIDCKNAVTGKYESYRSARDVNQYNVLCVEVIYLSDNADKQAKRKKHSTRMNETTVVKHSAQVFAEMLGQVCHEEFYKNATSEYQEVPYLSCLLEG